MLLAGVFEGQINKYLIVCDVRDEKICLDILERFDVCYKRDECSDDVETYFDVYSDAKLMRIIKTVLSTINDAIAFADTEIDKI